MLQFNRLTPITTNSTIVKRKICYCVSVVRHGFFKSSFLSTAPLLTMSGPWFCSVDNQQRKMTRAAAIQNEKEKYLSMDIKEKRKMYKCNDRYSLLNEIETWEMYFNSDKDRLQNLWKGKPLPELRYEVNEELNRKVSIWKGDITCLEIDAIVNAANKSLLGGGGVDGAIHSAAGSQLKQECSTLGGCDTGDAKITGGYKLPAKYVIHTVGPVGHRPALLLHAYKNCCRVVHEEDLTSVAFPCISTGIYGYPNDDAAHVAMETVRKFLESEEGKNMTRVIFCLFMPVDVGLYEKFMQVYFPCEEREKEGDEEKGEEKSNSKQEESSSKEEAKSESKGAQSDIEMQSETESNTKPAESESETETSKDTPKSEDESRIAAAEAVEESVEPSAADKSAESDAQEIGDAVVMETVEKEAEVKTGSQVEGKEEEERSGEIPSGEDETKDDEAKKEINVKESTKL